MFCRWCQGRLTTPEGGQSLIDLSVAEIADSFIMRLNVLNAHNMSLDLVHSVMASPAHDSEVGLVHRVVAMQMEVLPDMADNLMGLNLKAIHQETLYRVRILV
jgi:hypothetical protein